MTELGNKSKIWQAGHELLGVFKIQSAPGTSETAHPEI